MVWALFAVNISSELVKHGLFLVSVFVDKLVLVEGNLGWWRVVAVVVA